MPLYRVTFWVVLMVCMINVFTNLCTVYSIMTAVKWFFTVMLITVGDSDGIINGKRYFKCERPQAAVFVEANRVSLTVPVKVTL